jgi:hypothetical protein
MWPRNATTHHKSPGSSGQSEMWGREQKRSKQPLLHLYSHPACALVTYCPCRQRAFLGICTWPPHDPRHPSNVRDEPIHSPRSEIAPLPAEVTDTLTLGVSKTVHIPDSTPFHPEPCQPSVLRCIHKQVLGESSQG